MLVSAIITTHNRRELCKRACESALSQTFQDIECILVDDASQEGPNPEWTDDPRINYIYIPKSESSGGNHARNVGIKAARGKYVAFLDDDDYWMPDKIELQVKLLQEKNCKLVTCGRAYELYANGTWSVTECHDFPKEKQGDISKKVFYTLFLLGTLMIERELLETVGMFDENLRFWQDDELCIRLSKHTELFSVPGIHVVFRVDTNDKQRLSNNFTGWQTAVKYIHTKHRRGYRTLSFNEKLKYKKMVYADGLRRCDCEKLKWQKHLLWVKLKIVRVPGKIVSRLK